MLNLNSYYNAYVNLLYFNGKIASAVIKIKESGTEVVMTSGEDKHLFTVEGDAVAPTYWNSSDEVVDEPILETSYPLLPLAKLKDINEKLIASGPRATLAVIKIEEDDIFYQFIQTVKTDATYHDEEIALYRKEALAMADTLEEHNRLLNA